LVVKRFSGTTKLRIGRATSAKVERTGRVGGSRISRDTTGELAHPEWREKPFTVPHFKRWARQLVLDSGEPWEVEPFQARFAKDVFSGVPEAWLLLPEGNAKTTLVAGFALYHLQFTKGARVPAAASSRDQAEWLYQAAAGFVERSEAITDLFRCQEGYRRIRCDSTGSRMQIFAADVRTGDGVIPTLCLVDELHRHRNLDLYRTWRGKLLKRNGQIVAISTAGDPTGDFEESREKVRTEASSITTKGAFSRIVGEGIVVHEYAVPETASVEDMRWVKRANPLKAITIQDLRAKWKSPTMTEGHWRRYVCGRPSQDAPWIDPADWDQLRVDIGGIEKGESVWAAVDVGTNPAIALAASRENEAAAVKVEIFDGDVPLERLEARLAQLAGIYDIREVAFDRVGFQRSAELLETQGLSLVEIPHSPERISIVSQTLHRLVQTESVHHDGDPALRAQVLGAVTKETERGWRLVKSPTSRGLIAMAVAVHQATQVPDNRRSVYEDSELMVL
jgi:phage terminase large subunit-like protein